MDKASPHYRSKKVKDYLDQNKDTLIPVYLPTASPEFMMLEEVWNIAKQDSACWNTTRPLKILREDISLFQNKKIWSEHEELFTKDGLGTYMKWYNVATINRVCFVFT